MAKKIGNVDVAKRQINKKICSTCQKEKLLSGFYKSFNPFHKDGYTPICKDCIVNACYDEVNNEIDFDRMKSVLRQMDKPFITAHLQSAVNQYSKSKNKGPKKTIIGYYFKNINSLPQVSSLTYDEGEEYERSHAVDVENTSGSEGTLLEKTRRRNSNKVYYLSDEDFVVTEDLIRLFGEGYTAKEYETMKRIYDDNIQDYPNISGSQKNLLLRYIRFATKEEIATSSGLTAEADKWSKMATEALKQLNSIDIQGGVSCFSEFFRKIEREQDIIPILPSFKYRPNDAPDFIIWCFINYCRRLEGKEQCSYEDVYRFYDERKAEYIKQTGDPYGIFSGDSTLCNREKIKEFISLPNNYYDECGGDENDTK